MSVKLLTEHHLEFLCLKGCCTCWSESTLVKMPHCWKSHVMAQMSDICIICLKTARCISHFEFLSFISFLITKRNNTNIIVAFCTELLRVLLTFPRWYFFRRPFMLFLPCFCYAFVRVCLFVPCGHLLDKG